MGQREAIAFGEGVATTMRLKFEKLDRSFLPGQQRSGTDPTATAPGQDVDLAAIVNRLRTGSAQQASAPETSLMFAGPADATSQPGDPDYRRPSSLLRRPATDETEQRYGLKPTTFGVRPHGG